MHIYKCVISTAFSQENHLKQMRKVDTTFFHQSDWNKEEKKTSQIKDVTSLVRDPECVVEDKNWFFE